MSLNNRTKIVATVGPASNTREKLMELIHAGVDVFRLNFSHGSHEDHFKVIQHIRELNETLGTSVAILQDLQGPKIRLREVENNGIQINPGEEVIITNDKEIATRAKFTSTYDLAKDVRPGEPILIDDGNIELKVVSVTTTEVRCVVVYGGLVKSKKGINLPNTAVSEPSLTAKDHEDLLFGLQNQVDWVALSFVRNAHDLLDLRKIIKKHGNVSRIVAKIETPNALQHIDEIIEATDGVMVARGDLGVEVPMEDVPLAQKNIIQKCILAAKPVIVATQMMESMITNPRPTRAEANDVANAVMDGADAVMLSAETASGRYPTETVKAMNRILAAAEHHQAIYNKYHFVEKEENKDIYSANMISHSACRLAEMTGAKAILCLTKSGYSAFQISSRRPKSPIFVFTENKHLLTTLNLLWGVKCLYYDKFISTRETLAATEKILVDQGLLQPGDLFISTATTPMSEHRRTNMLKLHWVE
ncbi:MAG: pyruvate kinase [Bernardetiaceae bacterium]|jgi:pyruvate kinase|nr:pyruvate kinase [Bernardetiaceae bacterium]